MATATDNGTYDPLDMEVRTGGGGDFSTLDADNYPATVVGIIHVGTQKYMKEKDGVKTQAERPEVVLIYEIDEKQPDGTPFLMARQYNASMHDKATLYEIAASLLGQKYEQGQRVSIRSLLGAPCMCEVTLNPSKKDPSKSYNNLGKVARLGRGMAKPVPSTPLTIWTTVDGTPIPDLSWAPRIYGTTIETIIEESAEFRAGKVPRAAGAKTSHMTQAEADEADDIPF